ncbi:flagellin [Aliihoeflea sp. 2WW]|uniref:flagellin N-terminal helical domain-containing protein n=1 Tax=Aliihoeflea sp. 2WW TaxID=1381123 RepID=UPI0004B96056|nr:flagellin [Aliihoeflea sp. 2WW]
MASILTNSSAMTALQTLRSLSSAMAREQSAIATGLRVAQASDNAAYWSISVSMRSTVGALSAVNDALGLGAAIVDIAYSGIGQTKDLISAVRDRLVLASSSSDHHVAIQGEISQLAAQTQAVASSATVGGVNLLLTDVEDIWEGRIENRSQSFLSSYRSEASGPALSHIIHDLQATSLFNANGGGILERDPRSPLTLGGMRLTSSSTATGYSPSNDRIGFSARISFNFVGPLDFTGGNTMEFDLTVDADNPAHPIDSPYHPGLTNIIAIDQSLVEDVLPGSGGIVTNFQQFRSVLNAAMIGTGGYANFVSDGHGGIVQNRISIGVYPSSGLDGSQVSISNFDSSAGSGGLVDATHWGSRGNSINLSFQPFKVYRDVAVQFQFVVNDERTDHFLDQETINSILGRDDGRVETSTDMALLIEHLVGRPGLEISATTATTISINTDRNDRLAGSKSQIGFTSIGVNIEPIPNFGVLDIDIVGNPDLLPSYLAAVDAMLKRVITAGSTLGALKNRIEGQASNNSYRIDAIHRGIGQLVDADMEEASVRLRALEVQQQLALQALNVANDAPEALLQLYA